jgi:hypothetical protein
MSRLGWAQRARPDAAPLSPGTREYTDAMRAGIGWAAVTLAAMAAAAGANAGPNASVSLQGVSCTSRQACVAVGGSEGSPSQTALAWKLQDGAWQITATPTVGTSAELFGVSCPAPGACVAVGGGEGGTIALRLAGGVWKRMSVPAPDRSASLYGVSCPTTDWCLAAGLAHTETRMSSDVFNGSSWRTVATPVIGGVSILQLNALSCASRRFCMAVGDRTLFGPRVSVHPVAVLFNGSAWRVVPVAAAGAGPSLRGVSCPVAGLCIAVGNSNFYSGSPGRQLVMRYRAGRWAAMRAPGPTGTEPLAVSCTAPGACVAVGSLNLGAPVVERLAHGAWSIVPSESPGPPTTVGNVTIDDETLGSVACLKNAPCVAVGDDNGSPFSELIEPGRASLLPVPGP